MSCSDTTVRSKPKRSRTRTRIEAPATITSSRPGAMNGSARRSGVLIAASRSRTARASSSVSVVPWIRSGSYSGRSIDIAAMVVAVPATATSVRASRTGTAASAWSRKASTSATSRARSSSLGGSPRTWRSVSRTLPMSVLMAAAGAASPSTNSVLPPPMSKTRNGASSPGSVRVAPRKEAAASSSPVRTLGRPDGSRAGPNRSSRFAASRTALVAPMPTWVAPSARARRT